MIRQASKHDIPKLVDINRKAWLKAYPDKQAGISPEDVQDFINSLDPLRKENQLKSMMQNDNIQIYVEVNKSSPIGYIVVRKDSEAGEIESLYIHPDHQRIGVGSRLLNMGLKWLNCTNIFLEVAAHTKQAITFYKRHGFQEAGNGNHVIQLPSGKNITTIVMKLNPEISEQS